MGGTDFESESESDSGSDSDSLFLIQTARKFAAGHTALI